MKCANEKCDKEISVQQEKGGGKFCCRSCSNAGVPRITKREISAIICPGCGEQTFNKSFCDNKCQMEAQRKELHRSFLTGEYVGKHMQFPTGSWPRQLLIDFLMYECRECGISNWNNKPVTLEVNHIDGDAMNNILKNLEFLCPNCHSQTDTFRALNTGKCTRNGRKLVKFRE